MAVPVITAGTPEPKQYVVPDVSGVEPSLLDVSSIIPVTSIGSEQAEDFPTAGYMYNDWNTGFANAKVPAANIPTWATFKTPLNAYTFDVGDYLEMNPLEYLHDWAEGTPLSFHIHWATNDTDVDIRTIQWEIVFTWANFQGVFIDTQTLVTGNVTIPANTAKYTHFLSEIGEDYTPTSGHIGAYLCFRIRRIAADSGTKPTKDPFGLGIGIHYQSNSTGSRSKGQK